MMNVRMFAVGGAILLSLIVFISLPPILTDHQIHVLIKIMLFAYFSAAWNILGGYSGQLSFGHTIFVAVGAYTSTLLLLNAGVSPWIGMLLGGAIAAAVGFFIGFLSFRYGLRGAYFLLVTLAFAEITRIVALNTPTVGGAMGLYIPIQETDILNLKLVDKSSYYYVILIFLLFVLAVSAWVQRSAFGHRLMAIRENEEAAQALGIDVLKYKLFAIMLSAFMTALGGTLYAHYITFIDPHTLLNINMAVEIAIYSIVGGLGTVFGPLLGAALLIPVAEVIRSAYGQTYAGLHLVVYGVVLIAVIRFAPDGLLGVFGSIVAGRMRGLRARRVGELEARMRGGRS